jgi:hypothetical protein
MRVVLILGVAEDALYRVHVHRAARRDERI